jgi:uncharacterized RDD family membrane protein YckC
MAAAAIDYLIEGGLLLIVLWLAGDFGRRLVDGYREWLEVWMAGLADQSYQMPAVPVQLAADVQRLGFAQVGVYLVYSLVFLTTWGATIGMRLLGLKVVPAPPLGDRPTPPGAVLAPDDKLPWGRAVVRSVVWAGFFLPLFVLAQLLNCLRPLWHPRRQTFHDSLARTVVIRRR